MVAPISVGAPCLAPSPSHFKYLTGKMEPLPSATAQSSGPQGSCSSLFWASFFEESKQMEKLLLKLIGTHGLLEEHWDQTGAGFPCPTDPISLQGIFPVGMAARSKTRLTKGIPHHGLARPLERGQVILELQKICHKNSPRSWCPLCSRMCLPSYFSFDSPWRIL